VIAVYVVPYDSEIKRPRGRLFCSMACADALLSESPACWKSLRQEVSPALAVALYCDSCGDNIADQVPS
jgi:hypothetical protein